MVVADPPCSTSSAQGQANTSHDVFSKNDIEDSASFMGSVMASRSTAIVFVRTVCSSIEARASVR